MGFKLIQEVLVSIITVRMSAIQDNSDHWVLAIKENRRLSYDQIPLTVEVELSLSFICTDLAHLFKLYQTSIKKERKRKKEEFSNSEVESERTPPTAEKLNPFGAWLLSTVHHPFFLVGLNIGLAPLSHLN